MNNINDLVQVARNLSMSASERDEQRRNFAFGSSNIENSRITRDTITKAEAELRGEIKKTVKTSK